jgi:hypothetical protein
MVRGVFAKEMQMKNLKNNRGITLIETLFAAVGLAIMATALYPDDISTQVASNVQSAVEVHNAALANRNTQIAGALETMQSFVDSVSQ